MGHNINEYKLIAENFKASKAAKEGREIFFERNIIVTEEELLLRQKLNREQQMAYNVIIDRISSNRPGAFFVDGSGGTGKIFLYRALLATVRSKGFIALVTATSGVAASILPGGRTAHSRFKILIDIDENFSCNISKQSSLSCLIRDAKLIVWDEVSMAKKKMIETFDLLLKDLLNTNVLFGGKVVVFGGDFRQTLPVVRNGKREDFIHESLLYSDIWPRLEKLQLSENMRAKTDPAFCEYLMRIGNGNEPLTSENKIEIPKSFIVPYTTEQESLNALCETTFPNMHAFFCDASSVTSRVILTTKNDFVNEINDMLIDKFPKEAKTFVAIDETCESNDQSQYEDFLHSLNPAGLPPYRLTLKEICPIILLRNLNPCEGLCNGTRLTCCDFKTHVISAKIASGDFKNTHVFIPRIPLMSSEDEKSPVQFKRTQFPVRLYFTMTINKSQGQTLDFVGIYLREPVFSHGQLYVALSSAKASNCLKILIRPPNPDSDDDHSTYNIVYDEIIQKAFFVNLLHVTV
uniref:ATP-dependent DNA helicase n=1 Tax=Nicotiana sylvestris TaxID=4096 RepID=A0A1U7WG25_NICSY|nr:PREDICTED: ATP-dependent DNA helicase PIF1-like isoform X1 [Nicotiana sylvestris]XP_009778906.1 PREDICTED: ATP-dependent DNA helicase PIF1-like isoform X1 [Nicotiana sylvestris]XP_009778907.1 PREDICTED: ATP-dependent DNA helicase PIF1-like isoform X1 [Nicotiana sylvestris]XP_009778908.1 PREDICTED: ATP-dependent DNA helicase PIF1-like isoform X1 [Nicotiana sylvestris]XP_009778909.1 PREDICTED: ATP-dependent DNA helicase PIF1-like isoform X1 [Nicotiana sylvestris]XP_009778910.1 PREDICTED: ATP-